MLTHRPTIAYHFTCIGLLFSLLKHSIPYRNFTSRKTSIKGKEKNCPELDYIRQWEVGLPPKATLRFSLDAIPRSRRQDPILVSIMFFLYKTVHQNLIAILLFIYFILFHLLKVSSKIRLLLSHQDNSQCPALNPSTTGPQNSNKCPERRWFQEITWS